MRNAVNRLDRVSVVAAIRNFRVNGKADWHDLLISRNRQPVFMQFVRSDRQRPLFVRQHLQAADIHL